MNFNDIDNKELRMNLMRFCNLTFKAGLPDSARDLFFDAVKLSEKIIKLKAEVEAQYMSVSEDTRSRFLAAEVKFRDLMPRRDVLQEELKQIRAKIKQIRAEIKQKPPNLDSLEEDLHQSRSTEVEMAKNLVKLKGDIDDLRVQLKSWGANDSKVANNTNNIVKKTAELRQITEHLGNVLPKSIDFRQISPLMETLVS